MMRLDHEAAWYCIPVTACLDEKSWSTRFKARVNRSKILGPLEKPGAVALT